MDMFVPVWNNTRVCSLRDLESANLQQKQFYALLKSEFIKGHYLDVGDNVNYLELLIYDFKDEFNEDNDYEALCKKFETLDKNYHNPFFYKNNTLIHILLDYIHKNNWRELPILEKFVSKLTEDLTISPIIVKPIDWILELLKCSPTNETVFHIVPLFHELGFGIVPNDWIEKQYLGYGDFCVLYKDERKPSVRRRERGDRLLARFSRKDEYKFVEVFIKLAIKVILEDEIISGDLEIIDDFINRYTINTDNKKIPQTTKLHLRAVARWRLTLKKPTLYNSFKKYIVEKLSSEQRDIISKSLLKIACNTGYIRPKRIESLKKILPLLGVESQNIHSLIHRMLTDKDGFAVVEKKSDAVEFTITDTTSPLQSTSTSEVIINPEKLHIFEQQTKAAQELLSNIFNEEESSAPQSSSSVNSTDAWLEILKSLLEKDTWDLKEVVNMCKDRGVILGAVLEQINDFSYEKVEDAVIDDDGGYIYVTLDYKEQLI